MIPNTRSHSHLSAYQFPDVSKPPPHSRGKQTSQITRTVSCSGSKTYHVMFYQNLKKKKNTWPAQTQSYIDWCPAPDLRVNYISPAAGREVTQANLVLGLDSTQPPLWRLGFYIISDVYFRDASDPVDRVQLGGSVLSKPC